MSSSNFYNPQNDGVGFSKRWDYLHKTTRIFFEGFHTLFSIQYFLSALLFVSRFRLWLFVAVFCLFRDFVCGCFVGVLTLFCLISSFL